MNHFQKTNKKLEELRSTFFMIGLIVACSLTLMAFEWRSPTYITELVGDSIDEVEIPFYLPPITYSKEVVIPKVKIRQPRINLEKIEIIPDDGPEPSEEIVNKAEDLANEFDPSNWLSEDPMPMDEIDEPIFISGEMPEFIGGDIKLFEFLNKNVKYPEVPLNNGIEGTVYVGFTIGRNGKVRDVIIKRGINKLLDDEAIRVVKAMPDWKPGRQHGKKVSVYYTIPINFIIR